ncbi:hypothetical protein LOZ45_001035 [Ophidiomyces ophidiicola]|uniref:Uncharacterized protein n=1 Tax=Ophidiomyces ophidiicola TaxID=1387563 RepID=A0ACB8V323_9EURO|nr:hypothetical protein LOZ60_000725 [Ophidiomyces ophidiicola]KAI2032601.1 hypothetical protein LOZ45_001035 [Ophidiomyces ophidiicola]KAI2147809.1 hypothetical protein LOZ27_002483 [Ophidiomyces ophidiicola]KAI2391590.1 hypothetical protein LOY88_001114 [Ophidiomyces ophidiicola]KAI2415986.1 hypothetical protein LOY90_001117 [Ophidiomyces ophidiicola]
MVLDILFRNSLIAWLLCVVFLLSIGIAFLEAAYPGILPWPIADALSGAINIYLKWLYPIKSVDGRTDLPTCSYRWPNGQGDVGKFLDGIENSSLWEKRHGPVYRIWSGLKSEVVLTSPGQLQAVFQDSDKHIKAVNNNSGFLMGELLGQCVGLISPPHWQKVRSITEVPFRHQATATKVSDIWQFVRDHFDVLEKTSDLSRGLIHPAQDMKMLPFWVVCYFFYGKLSTNLIEELRSLAPTREELMKHVIRGGISRFTLSRYLPTQANKDLLVFKGRWQKFNREAASYARRNHPKGGDIVPIVQMFEAVQRGEISEEQLLQTLDEALYANLDVTTGGLSWNLVFLAAYPDCQQKLREEVQTMVADEAKFDNYLRSQSTYLQACILESSRLKPLAAFSVPQSAPTARLVDGFVIPANTSFVVDSYSLNVRNEYWAPDNETYRPERFLARKNIDLRYLFWRFGFGPRQCMGKYVADIIIRATLVYLVQNYHLSLLGKDGWARDKECWITHPDFQVRCERR